MEYHELWLRNVDIQGPVRTVNNDFSAPGLLSSSCYTIFLCYVTRCVSLFKASSQASHYEVFDAL